MFFFLKQKEELQTQSFFVRSTHNAYLTGSAYLRNAYLSSKLKKM